MKEFEGRLTTNSSASTLRGDRSFMALDRGDLPPGAGGPENPEEAEAFLRNLYQQALRNRRGGGEPPRERPPTRGEMLSSLSDRRIGLTTEQKRALLTDRKLREDYFNQLFEVVDNKPNEFFERAFNLYMQSDYDNLVAVMINGVKDPGAGLTTRQVDELMEDLERFDLEKRTREVLHNMNAILYLPSIKADQLLDQMQQFDSTLGDAAFRGPGILEMAKIYEEELRREMARNGGYLKPEAITGKAVARTERLKDESGRDILDEKGDPIVATIFSNIEKGEVEQKTKARFKEFVKKYGLKARDENGQIVTKERIGTELKKWQVDRTFITARAMMIMSERLLSLAAEGKVGEGLAQYQSLFLQDILQSYSPYYHLIAKYGITSSGFAAYLHKPEKAMRRIAGLGIWSPSELNDAFKRYKDNPRALMEAFDEDFYLLRQNPNRVGDALTHQSWRYIDDPEVPSAIKEFLEKGKERMGARWDRFRPAGAPTAQTYEEFIKKPEYYLPPSAYKEPGEKLSPVEKMKQRMENEWRSAHPGAPSIEEYEKYANEYVNWIGTALRFEKLRGELSKLKPGERGGDFNKAKAIIDRMIELQPHQLYLLSDKMRARVNTLLGLPNEKRQTPEQIQKVDRILTNLSNLESIMYMEREKLLENNVKFDDIRIEQFLNREDIVLDAGEREEVRNFVQKVRQNYAANSEVYYDELIYRREITHGFALWGEDVPFDEMNMSALGPTGGFVRRARDNKEQAAAALKELELLQNLRKYRHPDDIMKPLEEIFWIMTHYDYGKAQQNITDKVEGLIKFFSARTSTKIPVWGLFERALGKDVSMAKIVYGKTAPSWEPADVGLFLDKLRSQDMISEDQLERLKKTVPGSGIDVFVDTASLLSQLAAIALFIYIVQASRKSKVN